MTFVLKSRFDDGCTSIKVFERKKKKNPAVIAHGLQRLLSIESEVFPAVVFCLFYV